jgi:hypothetical protein
MSEKQRTDFALPTEITKADACAPRDLVVISQPKMGKGTILGAFTESYNGLVLDLEKGGYEYIPARKMSIYTSHETTIEEAFTNYAKIRNLLLENKSKYDYLIIDGLSDLDKLSDIGGTYLFMDSVMGKNFNRKDGVKLKYSDPGFVSVVEYLKDGGGYKWTRDWFLQQIEIFRQIAPYRIYAAHVADKLIRDGGREEVAGSELFLTGKLKTIFAAKVTSLAKLIAEDNKRYLNFDVANDSIIAGSRAPHLQGKILISEKNKETGKVKTFWDSIYKC